MLIHHSRHICNVFFFFFFFFVTQLHTLYSSIGHCCKEIFQRTLAGYMGAICPCFAVGLCQNSCQMQCHRTWCESAVRQEVCYGMSSAYIVFPCECSVLSVFYFLFIFCLFLMVIYTGKNTGKKCKSVVEAVLNFPDWFFINVT